MIDMEAALFVANSVLSEVGLMISSSSELVVMNEKVIENEISERQDELDEFNEHIEKYGCWEFSNKK